MRSEMKQNGGRRKARVAAAILTCVLAGAAFGCGNDAKQTTADAETGIDDAKVVLSEKAERLRKIGSAFNMHANLRGALPPIYSADAQGRPLHSWRVLILAELGEGELYSKIKLDEPWDSEWNSQFHSQMPAVFAASSDASKTAFSVVVGEKTPFAVGKKHEIMKTADGTSNTFSVVERKTPVCWMDPTVELTFDGFVDELAKDADGNAVALTLDGAPRLVPATVDAAALQALATASGGEPAVELERIEKPKSAAE